MNKSRLSLGLLALVLALAVPGLAFAQASAAAGNANSNAGFFAPHPILIYTVTDANAGLNGTGGSSTTQPVSALIVYNNGFVLSTDNTNGTGTGGGTGTTNMQSSFISQAQVNDLYRQLRRAGGLRIGGGPQRGSNDGSLLRTVTIITDTGDQQHGLATTFSTFDTSAGSSRIFDIINNFMNQTFNNGGSGGTGGSGS